MVSEQTREKKIRTYTSKLNADIRKVQNAWRRHLARKFCRIALNKLWHERNKAANIIGRQWKSMKNVITEILQKRIKVLAMKTKRPIKTVDVDIKPGSF